MNALTLRHANTVPAILANAGENAATKSVSFSRPGSKGDKLATNDLESQELTMLALQICLVYVNTLNWLACPMTCPSLPSPD